MLDNDNPGREIDLQSIAHLERFLRGFGTLSLPVLSQLELLTALALSLKQGLASSEGVFVSEENNPQVAFDYDLTDSLGNPLQVTYKDRRERFHDEELSKFFNSLTKIFARIRRKVLAYSKLARKERMRIDKRLYRDLQHFYEMHGGQLSTSIVGDARVTELSEQERKVLAHKLTSLDQEFLEYLEQRRATGWAPPKFDGASNARQ